MKKLILPAKKCPICGTEFTRDQSKRICDFKEKVYCSRGCYYIGNSGEKNYNYKRGYRLNADGYARDSKDVFIHRKVTAQKIGRELYDWENVHHIDEDKLNNHPDNLEILTNSEHRKLHAAKQQRNKSGQFSGA